MNDRTTVHSASENVTNAVNDVEHSLANCMPLAIKRRAVELRRALQVVQVLSTARVYLSTATVLDRLLCDFGTEYHHKEIVDDLRVLEEAGLVHSKVRPGQGPGTTTWRLQRDRTETLAELCEGPTYDVFEAGLSDELVSVEDECNRLNDGPANAAQVARMLEGRARPIKHVIVQPAGAASDLLWDVFAVSYADECEQLNGRPYNAAQVERLLELLSRPVRRLIVQADAPLAGEGWDVSAVELDGECDVINSSPYDAMQVGALLESFSFPVKRLIVRPCEPHE